MSGEKAADVLEALRKSAGPRLRAGLGAAGALGLYAALGIPAARRLMDMVDSRTVPATNHLPEPVRGEDLRRSIERFKSEHPSVSPVPVFASGRVPRSTYVSEHLLKLKPVRESFEKEYGIHEPGVYLRELSAPTALHELGHAAMDKKVPGISLMTHLTSALALPLLGWTILKKPVAAAGFIERHAPEISAALQIPLLAEEAAASIMAHETLKREGKSGKGELLPNWLTYLIDAGAPVAAQTAASVLKRGL